MLVVRSIGTPPELLESDPYLKLHWLEPGEFRTLPLARDPDSNKGTYGHALIVAGAFGKSGAAVMAARGALMRSGGRASDRGDARRCIADGGVWNAGDDDCAPDRLGKLAP